MSGQKSGNNILSNSVSTFGGIINISIKNQKVIEEVAFSISKRLTIPASSSGELYLIFDPTLVTSDYLVLLPLKLKAFGAGPIFVDLFINPDFDGDGTFIESVNRDFTSTKTAKAKWILNPTINNVGVKSPTEFVILSNGIPATTTAGGETDEDLIIVVDKTKTYMLRFDNQENTEANGFIGVTWGEIDNV